MLRAETLADVLVTVGAALRALPLADLPRIASMQVCESYLDGLLADVQIGSGAEPAAAVLAWADALPESGVFGSEHEDHIKLEVRGVLDGVPVVVWCHITGEHLVDAGGFLGLPLDGRAYRLPLAAVRGLAARREARTDA